MKPLLLALLVLSVLPACKGKRSLVSASSVHDSTVITVTQRDTTLIVPRSEATVVVPLPAPGKNVPATKRTSGRSTITVKVQDGAVDASCVCDTAHIEATLRDKLMRSMRTEVKEVKSVEVRYRTPWWLVVAAISGATVLILRLLHWLRRTFSWFRIKP